MSNFSHFGTGKEPSLNLEKLSYSDYHYYASGRKNTFFALFKIELKRRQCLFTTVGMNMIWPTKDRVIVEIPLNIDEYTLSDGTTSKAIPVELIACSMKHIKHMHAEHAYLKKFVGPVQVPVMQQVGQGSEALMVFAESNEAANHIIDGQIGEILGKIGAKNV